MVGEGGFRTPFFYVDLSHGIFFRHRFFDFTDLNNTLIILLLYLPLFNMNIINIFYVNNMNRKYR